MEKNDLILLSAILLILGCVEIISLILAGATSHDVAAWVEALGVLAAFVASLYLARRAEGVARDTAKRNVAKIEEKRVADAASLVVQILNFLDEMPAWVQRGAQNNIPASDVLPDRAAVLAELLSDVDALGMPEFQMTSTLASLRAKMNRMAEILVNPPVPSGPNGAAYIQSYRRAAGEIAADARADAQLFSRVTKEYFYRGGPMENQDDA